MVMEYMSDNIKPATFNLRLIYLKELQDTYLYFHRQIINKLITVRSPDWNEDLPVFSSTEGTPLNRHSWGDRLKPYSKYLG